MNYTPLNTDQTIKNQKSEFGEIEKLREKLNNSDAPADLKQKLGSNIDRIESVLRFGGNAIQVDTLARYIDWVVQLPFGKSTQDIFDIKKAKQVLDNNHFGLDDIKKRVLEYVSLLILQKNQANVSGGHAPILLFVGLAGTGKTSFAMSVAEALGRKIIRIPFGGLSTGNDLRGMSKMNPEAEPGLIIRSLIQCGSSNPVILLDEIDRVSESARGQVMGILLELLDPQQNNRFMDHFIDYPFDLSKAIFIATSNNTQNISTAVLDRLEIIQMPSYSDDEKIVIAKKFVLPKLVKEVGIPAESIKIDDAVWQNLARLSGYDPGIRSVERKVESMVRKIALRIVTKGENTFAITLKNMNEFFEL